MSGAKVSKTTGGLGAVDSRDFREQVASWLVSLARAARAEQAVVDAELDTSRLFCTRALQLLSSLRQYVEDETSAVLDGVLSSRKQLCGCVRADPQLCRQCHLKRMAAAVREVCSVVSPSAPPLVSLGATEEGLSCATELAALRQSVPAPGPSKTAREAGRSASSSGRHERGGGSEFASFSPRAVLQLHGLQRVEAALSVLRRAAKTDVVASCLEQRLPAWHQRCLLVRALFWLEQTCSYVADNQSAVDSSAGLLSVDQMYSAHVLARKEHGSAAMCYILSLLERDWESESGAAELLYAHLTPSGRQITNLLHRCHVAIREARARGVRESPACVGWLRRT